MARPRTYFGTKTEYNKEYHQQHREKLVSRMRQRRIRVAETPAECRDRHLKEYGFSLTQMLALINKQDQKCAACSEVFVGTGRTKWAPVVDHDHNTGEIRGILHNICNRIEGQVSATQLRALATYKELHYPHPKEGTHGDFTP